MKLKIEHIAPYLPYKLKAKFAETNEPKCRKYVIGTIGALHDDCSIVSYDTVNSTPDKYKPLLIPMTCFNDAKSYYYKALCIPSNIIKEIHGVAVGCYDYDGISIRAYETCLRNHIDIFDLIPKGLAVEKII